MPVHFSLSTFATDDIIDFVADAQFDPDAVEESIGRVCDAAEQFIKIYSAYPFLTSEPIHEFTALELRLKTNIQEKRILLLRMTFKDNIAFIFSQKEVPLDELYDVRKCICESHFPCYNDAPAASSF